MQIQIETAAGIPPIVIQDVTRVNTFDDENLLLDIDAGPGAGAERTLYVNPANIVALVVDCAHNLFVCERSE